MHILAKYRKSKGISQRDFAELVSVDQSVISKIETGLTKPGLSLAVRIQAATGDEVPVKVWVEEVVPPGSVISQSVPSSASRIEAAE